MYDGGKHVLVVMLKICSNNDRNTCTLYENIIA